MSLSSRAIVSHRVVGLVVLLGALACSRRAEDPPLAVASAPIPKAAPGATGAWAAGRSSPPLPEAGLEFEDEEEARPAPESDAGVAPLPEAGLAPRGSGGGTAL